MADDEVRLAKHNRRAVLHAAVAAGFVAGRADAAFPIPTPPKFEVSPNPVPEDAPFAARMVGLAPGTEVVVRVVVVDAADVAWEAWDAYRADDRGTVDLAGQAPGAGTFALADPMALVWLALPLGAPERPTFFSSPSMPTSPLVSLGGTAKRMAAANVDSWSRNLSVLDRRLRQ